MIKALFFDFYGTIVHEDEIHYHSLTPVMVFTSDDAKSYKPRSELFDMALKETNLKPQEVVHIGDSLNSDIKGASNSGINTIWINRNNKEIPYKTVPYNYPPKPPFFIWWEIIT